MNDARRRGRCGTGSLMSRIAWMMLKRLSQMLVPRIVTIAIKKPTTNPRCTLAHLNAKCKRDAVVVGAAPEQPRRGRHQHAPEPEPDERARDRRHERVAPALGRERADRASCAAGRPRATCRARTSVRRRA